MRVQKLRLARTRKLIFFSDQGTTSTSCSCAGSSVRPLGSERSCSIYPCLIFVDEFNTLDLDIWEHEITAGGGGVCISLCYTPVIFPVKIKTHSTEKKV